MNEGVILQAAPKRAPDRASGFARAWVCSHPDDTLAPANVVTWLVNYRPAGAYWAVGAVAMDWMRGFDRRRIQFPEATHEFGIYAISLEQPLADVDRWEGMEFIEPAEVREQVELHEGRRGDAEAASIVVAMVETIVRGGLTPHKIERARWNLAIKRSAHYHRERAA